MGTATGLTKERMLDIEAKAPVSGTIDSNGHLIITRKDGSTIDFGRVKGNDGSPGSNGTNGTNGVNGTTVPPGTIMQFSGISAPDGYLLCRGQAVSRSTYASLFAVIGTTYGSGNGSTTFNLPNLQGKVPIGLDSAQTEFDSLAETGGTKNVLLTQQNLPSATMVDAATANNDTSFGLKFSTVAQYTAKSVGAGLGITQTPVNTLSPYLVVNYIIRWRDTTVAGEQEAALTSRVAVVEGKFATGGQIQVIERKITDSGDLFPTLATGFSMGSTAERPTYRKKNGWVQVRGHIIRDSSSRVGVMFTLPAGYWPSYTVWDVITNGGGTVAELKVLNNGQVLWANNPSTTTSAVFSAAFPDSEVVVYINGFYR